METLTIYTGNGRTSVEPRTFFVWNCGVVTSLMGLSAQAFEGGSEVMRNGARVSRNPNTTNGMEKISCSRRLAIVGREGELDSWEGRNRPVV